MVRALRTGLVLVCFVALGVATRAGDPPIPERERRVGPVVVPPLVGRPFEAAEATLLDLGLAVVPEYAHVSDPHPWSVRAQRPAGGETLPNLAPVVLAVDLPAEPASRVVVPNLFGASRRQAARALEGLGFKVRLRRVPSSFPPGITLRQEPPPQARVEPGSEVALFVTARKRPGESVAHARLPRLEGLGLPAAFARLRQTGFRWQVLERRVPAATEERVLLQAPCADAPTPLGTLVTLVVPAFRTVPDLVGRTVREARTLAATAGLDLGVEAGTPSDAPVARQDPSSGERAAVGSTVRVVPGEPSPVKDG